jgi:hypothetical protein
MDSSWWVRLDTRVSQGICTFFSDCFVLAGAKDAFGNGIMFFFLPLLTQKSLPGIRIFLNDEFRARARVLNPVATFL